MVKRKTKKRKVKRKKVRKRAVVKSEFKPIEESIEITETPKKKINFPVIFVSLIVLIGLFYLTYTYKDIFLINYSNDVLEVYPELEGNGKIMEFLNEYEDRVFKKDVKGDYLYITIWSKDMKNCIVAIEDANKIVKQTVEPAKCDHQSLKDI